MPGAPVAIALLCGLLAAAPGDAAPAAAAAAEAPPPGGQVLRAQMDDEGDEGGQARFEAALALLRAGQERAAARALEDLARERPDDDVAPEALFEAAQIHDEQLGEPARARELYGELLRRYPQSRLYRRAQGREAELAAGLRTGAAPYTELQDILRRFREPDTAARLQRLLAAHPGFSMGDRARYLLGSALLDAGRPAEAEAALRDLLARHPGGEWAPRALQLLGQLALGRGDFREARARYAALGGYGGPLWSAASAQGLELTARAERRAWLGRGAALYLALYLLALALRGRRRLWPPPLEVLYLLPVGAFLVLAAALGGGGPLLQAILRITLGGAALTWLGGAAARVGAESPDPRRALPLRALLGAALRLLGALSLGYLVVYHGGLAEVVLETLRQGPERNG